MDETERTGDEMMNAQNSFADWMNDAVSFVGEGDTLSALACLQRAFEAGCTHAQADFMVACRQEVEAFQKG